jgi:hypothetical protein
VSISSKGDNITAADFRGERRLVGDTLNNGSWSSDDLASTSDSDAIVLFRSFDLGISSLNDFRVCCSRSRCKGGVPICKLKSSSATSVLGESRPDADCRKNWVIRGGREGVGAASGENKSVIFNRPRENTVLVLFVIVCECFKVAKVVTSADVG